MPLLSGLLVVTDRSMVNCFAAGTAATGFAELVACSPKAEARKKIIVKRVSAESNLYCFILIVDSLAPWINSALIVH
jgi:hypothetical protein